MTCRRVQVGYFEGSNHAALGCVLPFPVGSDVYWICVEASAVRRIFIHALRIRLVSQSHIPPVRVTGGSHTLQMLASFCSGDLRGQRASI